jgi:hypothetical protein
LCKIYSHVHRNHRHRAQYALTQHTTHTAPRRRTARQFGTRRRPTATPGGAQRGTARATTLPRRARAARKRKRHATYTSHSSHARHRRARDAVRPPQRDARPHGTGGRSTQHCSTQHRAPAPQRTGPTTRQHKVEGHRHTDTHEATQEAKDGAALAPPLPLFMHMHAPMGHAHHTGGTHLTHGRRHEE